MVSLLLGVAERPNSRDIAARARDATAAWPALSQIRRQSARNGTERYVFATLG
jgi:hypothetical protein